MPNTSIQENLDEFLGKYGKEGILVLYFSNLLEDMIRGEFLHTLGRNQDSSPGILEYSDRQGRLPSSELLDRRSNELRRECEEKAIEIVDRLRRKGYLEKFGVHKIPDELAIREINSQLKEIFEEVFEAEWGSEV